VVLLGDTLHNVTDALPAVPLLIAFRLARRPANARYTYGYGRAEDLAGLFVIAMITLSSVALLGAAGTGLGWRQADPIVGLLFTVAILGVLRSAVRQGGAYDIAHHAEAHLLSDVRRLTAAAVHARPAVPIGVAGVGRAPREPERDQQRYRGERVRDVVQGVAEQHHRPRQHDDDRLHRGRQDEPDQADQRSAAASGVTLQRVVDQVGAVVRVRMPVSHPLSQSSPVAVDSATG
jgi:Co/Zn/Cd efflux system component